MMALGLTGPSLRAAGLPQDLRKDQPYCGYENFEFDVPTYDSNDAYNRVRVRFDECYQSLRIASRSFAAWRQLKVSPSWFPTRISSGPHSFRLQRTARVTPPNTLRRSWELQWSP